MRKRATVGTLVSRYAISRPVGVGGTSIVYEAFDHELERVVAVKLLKLDDSSVEDRLEDAARLLREGQVLARLHHPNIVEVFDAGRYREGDLVGAFADDVPPRGIFIVEEFVDGATLRQWSRATTRHWTEVVEAFLQAGRGLDAAHAEGLVHRDFKPGNVMVAHDGRVRVLDFGLAGLVHDRALETGPQPTLGRPVDDAVSASLTRTGTVMGTPAYMAPEQHEGRIADERSDQYAYAAALIAVASGERPFRADTLSDLHRAKVDRHIAWPRAIDRSLRRVLARALAPSPADRYPSMAPLLDQLQAILKARRRRPVVVAAAATVAGLGTYTLVVAPTGPACDSGHGRVAAVWNDVTRGQARDALAASGAPYADDAWAATSNRLDDYADAWGDAHNESCERGDRALDERMACLDQRLSALAELVEILASADRRVAQRAAAAADALREPGACLNPSHEAGEPALPGDPALAEAVQEARKELGRIDTLRSFGRWTEAEQRAEGVLTTARSLGFAPLEAEAGVRLGLAQIYGGRHERAYETLRDTALLAESARYDAVALEAQTQAVAVLGMHLGRYEEALTWARHAEATLQRRPNPEDEARLLQKVGRCLSLMGRHEQAIATFDRALALAVELYPSMELTTLSEFGMAAEAAADYERARKLLSRAVELSIETEGELHPAVATARKRLGVLLLRSSEWAEAQEQMLQSLLIRERVVGPQSALTMSSLDGLGSAYASEGRHAEALPYHQRAAAGYERVAGRDAISYAIAVTNVANDYHGLGEYERSRQYFLEAVLVLEKSQHHTLGLALSGLGTALLALGRNEEAAQIHARAVELTHRHFGTDHPWAAATVNNLAHAESARGNCHEAIALAKEAINRIVRVIGPHEAQLSQPLMTIGHCHRADERPRAAAVFYERALRIRERGGDEFRIASSQFALARTLWELGQRHRALALARRARDAVEANPVIERDDLVPLRAWLAARG